MIFLVALFLICFGGILLCLFLFRTILNQIQIKGISKYPLPPIIHRDIYIDRQFDRVETYIIKESLKQWEKATCGIVKFYIINSCTKSLLDRYDIFPRKPNEFCDKIYISKNWSAEYFIKEIDDYEQVSILGYAYTNYVPNVAVVVADRMTSSKMFKSVVMHEVGHLLGIPHSWNDISLMNQYCTLNAKHITADDLQCVIFTAMHDQKLQYK